MNKQIKVTIDAHIADTFRNTCSNQNVSMSSVLSQLMSQYTDIPILKTDLPSVDSRRKRRAEIARLSKRVSRVKDAEEFFLDRIPVNLSESQMAEATASIIEKLEEIIDNFNCVFDE